MHAIKLQVNDSSGQRTVTVDKPLFTIGRQEDRDLVAHGAEVSREHAVIAWVDGQCIFRDTSRFGSYLNADRVTECVLAPGDAIRLGRGGGADLLVLPESGVVPTYSSITATAVRDLTHVSALLQGLSAIGTTRLLDDVLVLVLDSALEISGADRGFIMLANEQQQLELTLARARERRTLSGPLETSRKIPAEVFHSGRARLVRDLAVEGPEDHQDTLHIEIHSVLCLPLRLVQRVEHADDPMDERRIGVLYLDSREQGALVSGSIRMALETLATEAALAIENARLYRATLEQAALEQEMRIAAEIQRALMPRTARVGAGFETAAAALPCRTIGGDFFDYLPSGDHALRFALGDVAGKGPPAALMGALVQGMLAQSPPEDGPARMAIRINAGLVDRAIDARFVTLFCASLAADGSLSYCNAGHNPPLVVGPGGVRPLTTGGPIVGLFQAASFEQACITLTPGEWIVVFSDGLSEALNPAGEEFGDSHIVEIVRQNLEGSPDAMVAALFQAVQRFSAGVPQRDDITVLVVRYTGG